MTFILLVAGLALLVAATPCAAGTVEYDLVVAARDYDVTGRPVRALTLPGGWHSDHGWGGGGLRW